MSRDRGPAVLEFFKDTGNRSLLVIETEKKYSPFRILIKLRQVLSRTKEATKDGMIPASRC